MLSENREVRGHVFTGGKNTTQCDVQVWDVDIPLRLRVIILYKDVRV